MPSEYNTQWNLQFTTAAHACCNTAALSYVSLQVCRTTNEYVVIVNVSTFCSSSSNQRATAADASSAKCSTQMVGGDQMKKAYTAVSD